MAGTKRTVALLALLICADYFVTQDVVVDDVGKFMEGVVDRCPEYVRSALLVESAGGAGGVDGAAAAGVSGPLSSAIGKYFDKNLKEIYEEAYAIVRERAPRMARLRDHDFALWDMSAIPQSILQCLPKGLDRLGLGRKGGDGQQAAPEDVEEEQTRAPDDEASAAPIDGGDIDAAAATATASSSSSAPQQPPDSSLLDAEDAMSKREAFISDDTILKVGKSAAVTTGTAKKSTALTPFQKVTIGVTKVLRATVVGTVLAVMVILESFLYFMV